MADCFCLLQTHATSRVELKWGQGAHGTCCCHFKSFIAFDQVSQLIRNISKSHCLTSSSKSSMKLSPLLSEGRQQLQKRRRPQEGSTDDRPFQPARSQGGCSTALGATSAPGGSFEKSSLYCGSSGGGELSSK